MGDVPLPAGTGVGWRPEIAGWVAGERIAFCELIAESVAPAAPPRGVAELRERGVAVVPHGVRLSLGGADGLDPARVEHLAATAAAVGAPLVSEHVAFVRAGGRDAGHLLPVPRTREALDVLVAGVRRLRAELDVPLALEPVAALLDWPDDVYDEGEFLTELLLRTDALLLLDVANVHANAVNRGQDPSARLHALPLERVAYVHVAGGAVHDGLYHDTHTDPVPAPVLDLLRELPPGLPVMLERDGRYPPAAELTAELAAITAAAGHPHPTRGSDTPPRESDIRARESPIRIRTSRTPAGVSDPRDGSNRAGLAARQEALVAALVAGAPDPPGLDPDRLAATRRALLRKRAGEAARHWPLLAAALGADWPALFAAHHAGREPAGGLRDGWDVARAHRDRLTPAAVEELAEREAAWRYDGGSAPRPRGRFGRAVRRRWSPAPHPFAPPGTPR